MKKRRSSGSPTSRTKKATARQADKSPQSKTQSRDSKPTHSPAKSKLRPTAKSKSDPDVTAFLDTLSHPLKPELLALRKLILGVSPAVTEEFKWNSPSFRTTDHFATINVTGKNQLRLILHTGAKKKASAAAGLDIPDPQSLLKWLAKDRAIVTIDSSADLESKRAPLKAILVHWIKLV